MSSLKSLRQAVAGHVPITVFAGTSTKSGLPESIMIERRHSSDGEDWYPAASFPYGELDSIRQAVHTLMPIPDQSQSGNADRVKTQTNADTRPVSSPPTPQSPLPVRDEAPHTPSHAAESTGSSRFRPAPSPRRSSVPAKTDSSRSAPKARSKAVPPPGRHTRMR